MDANHSHRLCGHFHARLLLATPTLMAGQASAGPGGGRSCGLLRTPGKTRAASARHGRETSPVLPIAGLLVISSHEVRLQYTIESRPEHFLKF